jgi:hypothetical protein
MITAIDPEYAHFHGCTKVFSSSHHLASVNMDVDTNRHIYLMDHVFGGKCFVPATMIMEIFLEAALWYERTVNPGTKLFPVMLLNLNIERAIAMDPGGSLQVTINILNADRSHATCRQQIEIVSRRRAKNGKILGMRLNASCEVVLSTEEMQIPPVHIPKIQFDSYKVDQQSWYDFLFPSLFECFHASTGEVSISRDGHWLMGFYDCDDKESHFIKENTCAFISSPLGNDICLQYAVFLARYIAKVARLPVGGERILLARLPPKNGLLRVLVHLLDIDAERAVLDIVSFDQNYRPVFHAEKFVVKTSPFQAPLDRVELIQFFHRHCTTKTASAAEVQP